MASPKEIAKELPETLPEDFSGWDREMNLASAVESVDFDSFCQNQALMGELVDKLRSPSIPGLPAGGATNGICAVPARPDASTEDETFGVPEFKGAFRHLADTDQREANNRVFELFSAQMKASRAPKPERDQRMIVALVGAGSVLILLLFMIALFHPGTKSMAKQVIPTSTEATVIQPRTNFEESSLKHRSAQDKALVTNKKQPSLESPSTRHEADGNPAPQQTKAKVQTNVMNDQLTAPALISHDAKEQVAENAPPPLDLGTAGFGGAANDSAFHGQAQPIVKAATPVPVTALKGPLVISPSVALGMLVEKKMPNYPLFAKEAHITGTVVLKAIISKNGTVEELLVLNGPAPLQRAAIEAVRSWRYKPYVMNNQPTEVQTTINVNFSITQ